MTLEELIAGITPPSEEARQASRTRWDSLAKPLGSLGLLEEMVERIAALTGDPEVRAEDPVLLVFCADHGVVARGVSQTDFSVTAAVARALGEGRSTVNPMARAAGCRVIPVDMGIRDFPGAPGVLDLRVRNGAGDITHGPAMTEAECRRAILAGAELVFREKERGARLILTGEMGIGNTTAASAMAAVLLDLHPEAVTGRGAGLSDEGLLRKRRAVAEALRVNRPDPQDPFSVLRKLGGLELSAMCGAFLGGAAAKVPVAADGFLSALSALCAVRMCPSAKQAVFPSHVSAEPAGKAVLEALGLRAPIAADMRLGEGTGAVCLLPLLRLALAVYGSGQTFGALGIDAYTPQ